MPSSLNRDNMPTFDDSKINFLLFRFALCRHRLIVTRARAHQHAHHRARVAIAASNDERRYDKRSRIVAGRRKSERDDNDEQGGRADGRVKR